MWVAKPPVAPTVFCEELPLIGPPVALALAAIWASESGSNSPAFGPAGRAWPFSQIDGLGIDVPDLGGALAQVLTTLSVACVTTMPPANVARLPPVGAANGIASVSPISAFT